MEYKKLQERDHELADSLNKAAVSTVAANSSSNAFDVLINDDDPDITDTLTITVVGTPDQGGTVSTAGPGDDFLLYTPAPDFYGEETFTYTIQDPHGATDTATVSVTVVDVPDGEAAEEPPP